MSSQNSMDYKENKSWKCIFSLVNKNTVYGKENGMLPQENFFAAFQQSMDNLYLIGTYFVI